jgi:probable HAF family extracellular repeat protein
MTGLGDLPGGQLNSRAYGVSDGGSVVVGYGTTAAGTEAFRWTQASGMVSLGILPGFNASAALDVSADGTRVIGSNGYNSSNPAEAFLWDPAHGMRSLRDVLINEFGQGANLAGWTLTSAIDISADGQFIVGSGTNPNGNQEAWLARLVPGPALPGDYNNDGTVDTADYVVWRKTDGTQTGYDQWRVHFGENMGATGSASAAAEPISATIPEPVSIALAAAGFAVRIACRRRRK